MYSARCQVDAMAALLSALSAELTKKTIATRMPSTKSAKRPGKALALFITWFNWSGEWPRTTGRSA